MSSGPKFDPNDVTQTGPDAHSLYADLRSECPVGRSEQYDGFFWVVDYEILNDVAHRPDVFSSYPNTVPPMFLPRPMIPLQIDPPAHQGYRTMLNPSFTQQRIAKLEEPVREFAAGLCRELAARPRCDGVSDYAAKIPMFTLSTFFQIPIAIQDDFAAWTYSVVHEMASNPERAAESSLKLTTALSNLLEDRRKEPVENDLLSDIASGEVSGRPVSHDEAVDICVVIVLAGMDTTQYGITNCLRLLAQRPDVRRQLIDDPALLPSAVEEFLRYDGPVQYVARTARQTSDVSGVPVRDGKSVCLLFAAANRDPEVFAEPDSIMIDRPSNRHLAFGAGIHRCIGAHLARLELRVAIAEFLRCFPEFEVADDLSEPDQWATGVLRGPTTLPLHLGKPTKGEPA